MERGATLFQNDPEPGGHGDQQSPELLGFREDTVWFGVVLPPEVIRAVFQPALSRKQSWKAKVQSRFLCGSIQFTGHRGAHGGQDLQGSRFSGTTYGVWC